ncbi:GL15238 [Drosophila persimilis]|uniref:GL15238 n=1 Tax=Drosophila persimilis TaxID=7234 RepID=B4H3T8_DROPE|nr:GL15238 [Drosophila persimilis]
MLPLYTLILGLSVLSILPEDVIGRCEMAIMDPAPLILTSFGSRHLLTDAQVPFVRDSYESVQMYCAGGFSIDYFGRYNWMNLEDTSEIFSCNLDYFNSKKYPSDTISSVRCRGTTVSQLFESRTSLPDCGDHMTLVVAQDFGEMGSIKSAGICYDIVGLELKYVSYTAYPPKNRLIEKVQLGQLNVLGLDINVTYTKSLFKTVSPMVIEEYWKKDKQLKQLFGGVIFEYTSLVQDEDIRRQLAGYEECSVSRILSIELDNGHSPLKLPAHIWAHVRDLHPTGKAQDEFVVIGHNSPFFKAEDMKEFCPTMCEQVAWLKNSVFGSLRDYPAYGFVQCCRVQDVAHKLDNFPGVAESSVSTSTATPAES